MRKPIAKNRSPRWAFFQKLEIPNYRKPSLYHLNYLVRWRIIQTPWFGIYFHIIKDIDPNQMFHNHPWNFMSIVLKGGYIERFAKDQSDAQIYEGSRWGWKRFSYHTMHVSEYHYITDIIGPECWTLLFTGRRQNDPWDFEDPELGSVPFMEHPSNELFETAMAWREAA